MTTPDTKEPHSVDLAVGINIRRLRKSLAMSQQALADQLGLTFQQVQKYERGSNRVSASVLMQICAALKCNPNDILPVDEVAGVEAAQSIAPSFVVEARALYLRQPHLFGELLKLEDHQLTALLAVSKSMNRRDVGLIERVA